MRFDLGTLDSGERLLPFGLLVYISLGVGLHTGEAYSTCGRTSVEYAAVRMPVCWFFIIKYPAGICCDPVNVCIPAQVLADIHA